MTLGVARLLAERQEHHNDPKAAIWCAIKQELPRAVTLCQTLAAESKAMGEVRYNILPPKKDPELTRQITALLGVDRFRQLIEEETGMCFVLGACCAPAVAPTREAALAWLDWERQFELQTNSLFMC